MPTKPGVFCRGGVGMRPKGLGFAPGGRTGRPRKARPGYYRARKRNRNPAAPY